MKALEMRRSVGRLGLARVASALGAAAAVRVTPLEYRTVDPPELPGDGWHRVRTRLSGICGSDLSMIEGHASTYFDDVVSFPFVPGHEIVGELDDGTRVAIEPVLGHAARGFPPPFAGRRPRRRRRLRPPHRRGDLEPGDPDRLLLVDRRWLGTRVRRPREPAAPPRRRARRARRSHRAARRQASTPRCSPPAASRSAPASDPVVAVLGAGTMGLAAIAGLVALRARRRSSSSAPATDTSNARPAGWEPTRSSRPTSWPAPCAATTVAG